MPSGCSRRRLLGGGLAGLIALATGGYAWGQYSRRTHLRLRIRARNESDDRVELTVVGGSNLADGYETVVSLAPATEGGEEPVHVPGPWIKHAEPYAVRATVDGDELVLENRTLNDRLEDGGWGTDEARVTLVVRADGTLESDVQSR